MTLMMLKMTLKMMLIFNDTIGEDEIEKDKIK